MDAGGWKARVTRRHRFPAGDDSGAKGQRLVIRGYMACGAGNLFTIGCYRGHYQSEGIKKCPTR